MKLNRLGAALIAGVAVFALASCSTGSTDDDAGGDSGNSGGVNTDAPLYDQLPQKIKDAGVISIAGDTHPPYRTVEEGGEITGIDPELQAALSEQLGVPFEIKSVSGMEAILTGMLSGRYDGFNGPLRTTPEREKDFDAVVWMTTITSYVYLSEREDELADPEALCGARVAGVGGSVTESQLERYGEWCVAEGLELPEFIGLDDTNATFLAVNSDRADYAGTTQTAAIDLQATDPGRYEYLVQSADQGAGVDQLAFFVPKGSDMAEPLLAAFEAIFDNGEYERIMTEWNLTDVAVEEPVLNPMTAE
ncbi:ABC transporter substrate-binding protein [Microbacterium shaanxiense]